MIVYGLGLMFIAGVVTGAVVGAAVAYYWLTYPDEPTAIQEAEEILRGSRRRA